MFYPLCSSLALLKPSKSSSKHPAISALPSIGHYAFFLQGSTSPVVVSGAPVAS